MAALANYDSCDSMYAETQLMHMHEAPSTNQIARSKNTLRADLSFNMLKLDFFDLALALMVLVLSLFIVYWNKVKNITYKKTGNYPPLLKPHNPENHPVT